MYIEKQVSRWERKNPLTCKVVSAHYFRGRLRTQEIKEDALDRLTKERGFDETLQYHNITTHYLPLREDSNGTKREKGIDSLMAIEVLDQAVIRKELDIVVLITGDVDHVGVVRKLHKYGVPTLLLAWNLEYKHSETGETESTWTSKELQAEVMSYFPMGKIIERGIEQKDPLILNIFRNEKPIQPEERSDTEEKVDEVPPELYGAGQIFDPNMRHSSTISRVFTQHGYGFIHYEYGGLYFHRSDVAGEVPFEQLKNGGGLTFKIILNTKMQRQAVEVSVDDTEPKKE